MKLGKMGHELAQVSETYQKFQFFGMVALWILGCHAISVQVFTRRNFGARHLSLVNAFLGLTAISFYSGIGNVIIGSVSRQGFSNLMEFLYTTAVVLCAFHLIMIWWKRRNGVILHTMYSGEQHGSSLLAFTGLSEGTLKLWVEPIILLMLAALASRNHQAAVALWLKIGSFSVFVHEAIAAHMEKTRLYDLMDSMIEANYRTSLMHGKAVQEQGFSMSKSSIDLMQQIPAVPEEYSDDVHGMLDKEEK